MHRLVDISKYQGKVTPKMVASFLRQDVEAVIIKASQGADKPDPLFVENANALHSEGFPLGSYHFLERVNPGSQFKLYTSQMEKLGFDMEIIPNIDAEKYRNAYPRNSDVYALAVLLKGWMVGRKYRMPSVYPGIYSSPDVILNALNVAGEVGEFFQRCPLWIAHWNVDEPSIVGPWKGTKAYLWQRAVIPGGPFDVASKEIDEDVWGDLFQWPFDDEPEPEPSARAFRLKIDGYKEITGILEVE